IPICEHCPRITSNPNQPRRTEEARHSERVPQIARLLSFHKRHKRPPRHMKPFFRLHLFSKFAQADKTPTADLLRPKSNRNDSMRGWFNFFAPFFAFIA